MSASSFIRSPRTHEDLKILLFCFLEFFFFPFSRAVSFYAEPLLCTRIQVAIAVVSLIYFNYFLKSLGME